MFDNDNIMTAEASEVKVSSDEKDYQKYPLCVIVSI